MANAATLHRSRYVRSNKYEPGWVIDNQMGPNALWLIGAKVWATDLWIPAEENHQRIDAAGVSDLVTAIPAEAHTLSFDPEFFDALVSFDAYRTRSLAFRRKTAELID
jgi:hypothetical protein